MTHDISIDNFNLITEEFSSKHEKESEVENKCKLIDDDNKKNYEKEKDETIDSNRLQDVETGSQKTSVSKDSGNESEGEGKTTTEETGQSSNKRTSVDDKSSNGTPTRSAELERVHERMKALGLRKELCADEEIFIKDDEVRKVRSEDGI